MLVLIISRLFSFSLISVRCSTAGGAAVVRSVFPRFSLGPHALSFSYLDARPFLSQVGGFSSLLWLPIEFSGSSSSSVQEGHSRRSQQDEDDDDDDGGGISQRTCQLTEPAESQHMMRRRRVGERPCSCCLLDQIDGPRLS